MRLVPRLHGRCLSSSESTSTSVAMTRAKAAFPSEVPVVFQGTPYPPDKPAVSCPGLEPAHPIDKADSQALSRLLHPSPLFLLISLVSA